MDERFVLGRIADLLRRVFLAVKRVYFDGSVEGVQRLNDLLFIDAAPAKCIFKPFPGADVVPHEYVDAVLSANGCLDCLTGLSPFLERLLEQVDVAEASETELSMANTPLLPLQMVEDDDEDVEIPLHTVFKVTLGSGEAFVVDPSCSQYGLSECAVPWAEYDARYVSGVVGDHPIGHWNRKAVRIITEAGGSDRSSVKFWYSLMTRLRLQPFEGLGTAFGEALAEREQSAREFLQLPDREWEVAVSDFCEERVEAAKRMLARLHENPYDDSGVPLLWKDAEGGSHFYWDAAIDQPAVDEGAEAREARRQEREKNREDLEMLMRMWD